MAKISRRKLIGSLGASVLAGGLPSEGSLANAMIDLTPSGVRKYGSKEFVEGCIFVRRKPEIIGVPSAVSIDFWTSRVSDIEIDPPDNIGQVIVWDDIFFKNNLLFDICSTARHISKWFYTPSDLCAYSLYLRGCNTVAEAILQVVSPERESQNVRIAIINAVSCGPTPLEWPSILPTIREAYDLVIGVSYSIGNTMGDSNRFFEEPIQEDWELKEVITHCDAVFIASDELVGFNHCTTLDERHEPVNDLFRGFIDSLADPGALLDLCNRASPTVFCIGPARSIDQPIISEVDRQASIVSGGFSDGVIDYRYDGAPPIIFDEIILWPLVREAPIEVEPTEIRYTTNPDVVSS